MAQKVTGPRQAEEYPMRFKCKGLKCVQMDGDESEFVIMARPLEINYSNVEAILRDAGIPDHVTPSYIEGFARLVEQGELARWLSERMVRVA